MSDIQFIDDITSFEPKRRSSDSVIMSTSPPPSLPETENPFMGPITPRFTIQEDKREVAPPGYPPQEFFQGPLSSTGYESPYGKIGPPPGVTMIQKAREEAPRIGNVQNRNSFYHNCIDIDQHIQGCPVCSRLHKSTTRIYMGIIVCLVIMCVILGRKYFN